MDSTCSTLCCYNFILKCLVHETACCKVAEYNYSIFLLCLEAKFVVSNLCMRVECVTHLVVTSPGNSIITSAQILSNNK